MIKTLTLTNGKTVELDMSDVMIHSTTEMHEVAWQEEPVEGETTCFVRHNKIDYEVVHSWSSLQLWTNKALQIKEEKEESEYRKGIAKSFLMANEDDLEAIALAAIGDDSYKPHAIEPDCGVVNLYFKREEEIYLFQIHRDWDMLFSCEKENITMPYNPANAVDKARALGYDIPNKYVNDQP